MALASIFLETAFSFNGSNILIDNLIHKAKQANYKSLVLTDKKMHVAYQFYRKCKEANITPVIGLQLQLEPVLEGSFISVLAFAQNTEGYKSLLKLSSLQSYNQTLPFSLFKKYNQGITLVLLLHEGELHQQETSENGFKTIVNELTSITDSLFIAINNTYKTSYLPNIPRIYMDVVQYMESSDYPLSKALKTILNKPINNFYESVDTSFKALSYFEQLDQQSKENLAKFIEKHALTLELKTAELPAYKNDHNLSSEAYLRALSEKGLEKRLRSIKVDKDIYHTRLQYELSTIHKLGYDDYFLIVWDVIKWARSQHILVGPGRGSAPGSLVAWSLGITHVDPIAYDLLFERFLNEARLTMPDIDIDFPDYARERVIEYAKNRFGMEYVSHICTFGTFLKKSALRETAKLHNIEKKHIDEMIRRIDKYESIADMVSNDPDVINRMTTTDAIYHWLHMAKHIEGLPKHVSTHAAGIIISDLPITEYSAIQEGLPGYHQTQYAQEDLENMGLLKMDFLGLRNLSMIEEIVAYIKKDQGFDLNMYQIPLNDDATFELLRIRSSTGIFQLESRGMRQLIKDMQIKEFEDIVAILALFRPGPMQSIDTYLSRRQKKENIEDLAHEIKDILSKTQGILLYQEQIMAIASEFAGYSMIEADLLRRAVSKKSETLLLAERQRFVEKSMALGKDEARANKIYDYIVTFANYGFNRSHSVAYAMISYWMAYLKAHYPAYFVAVLMQSALGNEVLLKEYVQEAMQLGITVKGPDVQVSEQRFVLNQDGLFYPLIGIKNIGKNVVDQLLSVRQEKPFKSFMDFVSRTHHFINKRAYQYLIYSGACDVFNLTRKTMLENLESAQHFVGYQGSIEMDEFVFANHLEYTSDRLKHLELDAMGCNLSYDPLKGYEDLIKKQNYQTPATSQSFSLNQTIHMIASIGSIKEITTKTGDLMAFVLCEDKAASIESILFPSAYKEFKSVLEVGTVRVFEGRIQIKKERKQFIVNRIKILQL